MSRVFLAEDVALHRDVVIKVLHPELAAGVNAERFNREVLLSARLPLLGAVRGGARSPRQGSLRARGMHSGLLKWPATCGKTPT